MVGVEDGGDGGGVVVGDDDDDADAFPASSDRSESYFISSRRERISAKDGLNRNANVDTHVI